MKTSTSWGHVADWYHDLLASGAGTYQQDVILPNILRRLGEIKGKTILDLACGSGFFTRAFYRAGALVVAVDLSSELVKLGQEISRREKSSRGSVTWHVASADKIPMVKDRSMDTVTIILAIQNMENALGVFRECARVLKPGGRLLIVMNHPAFRVPQQSDWGWDEKKTAQYRRVDEYLSESKVKIDMHPGEKKRQHTISFHRPLQVYFKHLAKVGFAVTRLEEWISNRPGPKGKRFAASEKARHEIPLFLFLEGNLIGRARRI